MGPVKLTSRLVEATRKEAQQSKQTRFLWDTELRGFGVKATPLGHVSWLVQKWVGGRDGGAKRIVIGHLSPAMGLDKARHEAGIVIGDVHKHGIASIVSRKKQQRVAQREALRALSISESASFIFLMAATSGSSAVIAYSCHVWIGAPSSTSSVQSRIHGKAISNINALREYAY